MYSLSLIYFLVSVMYSLLSEDNHFPHLLFFSHKSIKLTIIPINGTATDKTNDSQN